MIELQNVHKSYRMGDSTLHVLKGITLKIEDGEFIAIMGSSGSGKSTLMHIMGLLDIPDSGSYQLLGKEVSKFNDDELAEQRTQTIGFVFQQFNLLPRLTALQNVTLPHLYSKQPEDLDRAKNLLSQLGLGDRTDHKPNELSGGQQQRVAIARSMMNSPKVILADEPTGNLDSASKEEILNLLKKLNDLGVTVLIVTHEEEIARQVRRLIRIRDGVIQSDEKISPSLSSQPKPPLETKSSNKSALPFQEMMEHFKQGFRALLANKVRTALSVLGILIGVAAVVAMLALGRGAQKAIEAQISSLGSNLLVLRPGSIRVGGVALESGAVTRLTLDDVSALPEKISGIKEVSPNVTGRGQITYLNQNWNTQVLGVGPSYPRMRSAFPTLGRFFTEEENMRRSRVAVVGMTLVRQLFKGVNPTGEMIKINKIIFQVIGVLPEMGANGFRDQDDVVVIPIQTGMHRLLGKDYVDYIDIEVEKASDMEQVQKETMDLMFSRHKVPPSQKQDAFQVRNMADIQEALSSSSKIMSTLLASIAAISLLVGGIGIMNIMLVSVTERTREIGLRKAIGARKKDILNQFLAESVVVSGLGGLIGIVLGCGSTMLITAITGWLTSISVPSILIAFIFSGLIGMIFGIYPARKAAQLNPIEALRYE